MCRRSSGFPQSIAAVAQCSQQQLAASSRRSCARISRRRRSSMAGGCRGATAVALLGLLVVLGAAMPGAARLMAACVLLEPQMWSDVSIWWHGSPTMHRAGNVQDSV